MRNPEVQAAVKNLEARFVANGVDVFDFRRVTASIGTWPEWIEAWDAHGDQLASEAQEAEADSRIETAGEFWRRASISYHYAKYMWMAEPALQRHIAGKASAALANADRLLSGFVVERLEITFDGAHMVAILRIPHEAESPPLVVVLPGLDSTKEESFHVESTLHRRGLATLMLEGPGQGETAFELPLRPDYEVPFSAALDYVQGRRDIDMARVGILGLSLGGHYAPRVLAYEARCKAAVAVSGPYCMAHHWDERPVATRETFRLLTASADEAEAKEKSWTYTLEGITELVHRPLLVMTGDLDHLVPWEDSKRIADETPGATWKLFEGGNHVANNMAYRYRSLAADWLREQLNA